MTDRILCLAFRLWPARWLSDLISERRVEARWRDAVAAHIAAGGRVVTVEHAHGSSTYFLEDV